MKVDFNFQGIIFEARGNSKHILSLQVTPKNPSLHIQIKVYINIHVYTGYIHQTPLSHGELRQACHWTETKNNNTKHLIQFPACKCVIYSVVEKLDTANASGISSQKSFNLIKIGSLSTVDSR